MNDIKDDKPIEFPIKNNRLAYIAMDRFEKIPGKPIAYWISNSIIKAYSSKKLSDIGYARSGLQTGNNDLFLKQWFEVNVNNIAFNMRNKKEYLSSNKKWVPQIKGGSFRKWYGNFDYVVNWLNDGYEIRKCKGCRLNAMVDEELFFAKGITWSHTTSGVFGARYLPKGHLFNVEAPTYFEKGGLDKYILGMLNSKIAQLYLNIVNSTVHYLVSNISNLPLLKKDDEIKNVSFIVDNNIKISKSDWDLFETSWDFEKHPLIEFKSSNIENSFNKWSEFTEKQFNQLKSNEEELNRIFIDIYGLQDELTPEVEDKDITIRKADRDREMKSFISYAVGCMMGRYSLDEEGLVYAGGAFDINKYKTFKVDEDAIIPITDDEYFEDDIVAKFVEFVKVVFGQDSLEENLNYIADTECFKRKSNETSRNCLRRYFLKGFMEDHLKVYQKRPIYWMFDSGKQNGFKALIYMHRYDENMIAKIRTDYLHRIQRTYESEIIRLEKDINSEVLSTKEKTRAKKDREKISKQIDECKTYDQVIAHVANQRISIDLDDGVKVNYNKLQGIEIPQGQGRKSLKVDLLFKVKM